MSYTYTSDFGNNIILAPCLQVLAGEIAKKYPAAVNLGEIGDTSHVSEGYGSDHNPFITHGGKRYVRAIDIGGSQAIQQALFNFIQARYAAHDPRVYPYGYVHKDGVITTWWSGGTHFDSGDYGHLHISVTQLNGNNPNPNGWVPGLDSRAPWGLATPVPAPHPPAPVTHIPTWPLQPGNYFGLITGPNQSHGGYYASEQPYIKLIQNRLTVLGHHLVADGKFGPATKTAVAAWQHAKWSKYTTRFGEIWSDDWKRLFS